MNSIISYMVTPKQVMDLQPDMKNYYRTMESPYVDSILHEAECHNLRIGKIHRKDYGLCSKERTNDGVESYIVKFWANVLKEPE